MQVGVAYIVVLTGQEQDAVGGGFNIEESFIGEMSQMVMFDYALSADEVAELATSKNASCSAVYGQLLSWTDVLIGQRHGDVSVVNQSRCLGQQTMRFPFNTGLTFWTLVRYLFILFAVVFFVFFSILCLRKPHHYCIIK